MRQAEIGGDRGVRLALAAACTTQAENSPYFGKTVPPEGQHMRYISGSEPESLDPQVSSGQPEARLYIGLFDGLTEYHPETAQPIPALAERWEPNADNSEFTFHLRDAKWSNGDPITAHDFVYSLRRGLAPEFAARTAYLAYYIKGAQAYNEGKGKAEDVGVDCRRRPHGASSRSRSRCPSSRVSSRISFSGRSRARPSRRYGQAWTQPENIVTSGAFTLKTWKPYNQLVYVRNPQYWDAANVRLESITFYPVEDATTMMNLYKAGEVDAAVQPHSARRVDRSSAPHGRSHGQARVRDRLLHAEHDEGADGRRPRAQGVQHGDRQGRAGRVQRTIKPLTAFSPEGIFPGYPQPDGDPFDPRAREATARRSRLSRRQRQLRSGEISDRRSRAHLQHHRAQSPDRRIRAGAVEAEPRPDRAAQEHGVEDVPRLSREARIQGRRADRVGRRLHGSVHLPRSVQHEDRRQRHRMVAT